MADPETFEIKKSGLGKDKNFVYFYGNKLGFIDLKTFEIVKESHLSYEDFYIKDKKSFFFLSHDHTGIKINRLEGLSLKEIQFKQNYFFYAFGDKFIYYKGKIIKGADPKFFQVLSDEEKGNNGYKFDAEDKNNKYKYGEIIK